MGRSNNNPCPRTAPSFPRRRESTRGLKGARKRLPQGGGGGGALGFGGLRWQKELYRIAHSSKERPSRRNEPCQRVRPSSFKFS